MPADATAAASMYAEVCGEPGVPASPAALTMDVLLLVTELRKLRASMREGALRELATYSAVLPSDIARSGSAPACDSSLHTATCSFSVARCSGVYSPYCGGRARMLGVRVGERGQHK